MRYIVITLLTLGLASFLSAQSPVPSAADRSPPPRLAFTPPVTPEEELLRSKITSTLRTLTSLKGAGGTPEAKLELRASVEEHFDYLSAASDRMLLDLKGQVEHLEQDNARRKAAKADLVDAEVARLIHESRRVSFVPPVGALMRNTAGRRSPDSQRAE